MSKNDVINLLQKHRQAWMPFGVKSMAVFGSVARGESHPESDIDILVDFEGQATFNRYMDLKFYLEDLLGRKVDLVTPKALKPRMRPNVEEEAIYVA